MRIFRFLLLICILTSCDHPKKPFIEELTWPKRTVKLDNDLGILSIRLPKEFDTFYKYDYTDDNPCSDFRKYKFQNNSFPILKEDGGWVAKNVDSICSVTISHNIFNYCSSDINMDSSWIIRVGKNYLNYLKESDKSKIPILDTIIVLSLRNRTYYAYSWRGGDVRNLKETRNFKSANIRVSTKINKDYILYLEFQCAASNCDSFIPKMYKALKTVEIKPN